MAISDQVSALFLTPTFTSLLLSLVCVVVVLLLIRRIRYVAYFKDIPGPKGYPVIGNVLQLLGPQTEVYKYFLKNFDVFGDVYRLWIGTGPYVFIGSAESVQPVLSSSDKYTDKASDYDMVQNWLGTGLITSRGEKWHYRRKLLTPSFHFKLLESFILPASSQSDTLVRLLEKEVGKNEIDITEYADLIALDIIAETAMGYQLNAQTNSSSDFIKATKMLVSIILKRMLSPWLKIDFIFKHTSYAKQEADACRVVHDLRNTIVKERRAARKELKKESRQEGKTRLSLLDFMLEVGMSDEDIGEEVDTFMFAGHETVATTVSWCLFVFAQQEDLQAKILKEFAAMVASTENPFSVTSLNKLEYLERCVKEAMRLYTPVPFILRTVAEPIKINDHYLPAGTTIFLMLQAVHKNPRHFPDPEKFDPDRFLPDISSNRHPYAYVPFSAGFRNCIGQKYAMLVVKVILIKILEAYRISTSMRPSDLKLYAEAVLQNEGGIKISFQKRNEPKN